MMLLVWGKANFESMARENLHHLMFITVLFLVKAVGHMDPHIIDWATKPFQMPTEFELATYKLDCDTLAF